MFLSTILMLALSIEAQHFSSSNIYGGRGGDYNYNVETNFGGPRGNRVSRHPDRPPPEPAPSGRSEQEAREWLERYHKDMLLAKERRELTQKQDRFQEERYQRINFYKSWNAIKSTYSDRGYSKDSPAWRTANEAEYIVWLANPEHYEDTKDISNQKYLDYSSESFLTWGNELLKFSMDLATGITPGVSWARDIYEAFSYKNLITGEYLSCFEHTLAIAGMLTGGGLGSLKAIDTAKKGMATFTRLIKAENKLGSHGRLLYEKTLYELKQTVSFFKEHKIWDGVDSDKASNFVNSFMKGAEITKAQENIKVFRYYDPQFADPRGFFVTTMELTMDEARQVLALPFPVTHRAEWTVVKGTSFLKGVVAPQTWEVSKDVFEYFPGGGVQYVLDKNLLK